MAGDVPLNIAGQSSIVVPVLQKADGTFIGATYGPDTNGSWQYAIVAFDAGANVKWTKTGDQNANVKIQLFKGTTLVKTLATSIANSGSFGWTIPSTLKVGSNYKIKIKTTDGFVSAVSGLFTIH